MALIAAAAVVVGVVDAVAVVQCAESLRRNVFVCFSAADNHCCIVHEDHVVADALAVDDEAVLAYWLELERRAPAFQDLHRSLQEAIAAAILN
jgi:hypothetical protein